MKHGLRLFCVRVVAVDSPPGYLPRNKRVTTHTLSSNTRRYCPSAVNATVVHDLHGDEFAGSAGDNWLLADVVDLFSPRSPQA